MGDNGAAETETPNRFLRATKFTDAVKNRFLELVAEHGPCIAKHARAVDVSPETVRVHRRDDSDFAEAFEVATGVYRGRLEEEILRRGVDGWDEPIFYKGAQVGVIRRFDSGLLLAHARRHIPEYRDKLDVNAHVTGGILVVSDPMPSDEWEKRFSKAGGDGGNGQENPPQRIGRG